MVRIQFFQQIQVWDSKKQSATTTIKWYPAVRCVDYYHINKTDDPTIQLELSSDTWICPEIDSFEINNDPIMYKYGNGTSFNMVVNACDIAEGIDEEFNITSYATGTKCSPDTALNLARVRRMTAWSKIMTQGIGTPYEFNQGKRIPTYFTNRLKKGISSQN